MSKKSSRAKKSKISVWMLVFPTISFFSIYFLFPQTSEKFLGIKNSWDTPSKERTIKKVEIDNKVEIESENNNKSEADVVNIIKDVGREIAENKEKSGITNEINSPDDAIKIIKFTTEQLSNARKFLSDI